MPPSNEKLASALTELHALHQGGTNVFKSAQLSRTSRERLLKHGFVHEVMRGWLMSASPNTAPGDTTPWFASFWEFCWRYCDDLFANEWHLSPEQSLLVHAESTRIPDQVIVHSPRAGNNRIDLLFKTSLFGLRVKMMPPAQDLEIRNSLRVFRLDAALAHASPEFFVRHPVDAQVVAQAIRDPSQLLVHLLDGGRTTIAGRLAGLFRRLDRGAIADEILAAMKAADHDVRETDPFSDHVVAARRSVAAVPLVARLRTLWAASRDAVLAEFPEPPGLPKKAAAYLRAIDGVYTTDAYHSLSIEGYQVTAELIERVQRSGWNPDDDASDRETRNALAARGYWLAFQKVRSSVERISTAKADATIVRTAHRDWYREMFSPYVAAGMSQPSALAGYRNAPVYILGSRHVPPRWDAVSDGMSALFDLVEAEPEPSVRAVLGHWLVGYVHPFHDGNGRLARFIMNALFATGGYPWTVIRVEDRNKYLASLERASVANDVRPFAKFIAKQMSL